MKKLKCLKCGYEWYPNPRNLPKLPNRCARCNCQKWDQPKRKRGEPITPYTVQAPAPSRQQPTHARRKESLPTFVKKGTKRGQSFFYYFVKTPTYCVNSKQEGRERGWYSTVEQAAEQVCQILHNVRAPIPRDLLPYDKTIPVKARPKAPSYAPAVSPFVYVECIPAPGTELGAPSKEEYSSTSQIVDRIPHYCLACDYAWYPDEKHTLEHRCPRCLSTKLHRNLPKDYDDLDNL